MDELHIFPDGEEDKHMDGINCKCKPKPRVAQLEGKGVMFWLHNIIDWPKQFKGFIKI